MVFFLALILFGVLFQSLPVLYDTDSYYHLAIGRAYARHGVIDELPWARLSLLHELGDKELLFHLLLVPFTDSEGFFTDGGRWALALLNALVAAALAGLGTAAIGRWGLLATLLVYGGSLDFLGRAIRLRPELLSLLLLLAAVVCAARGRYRLLGAVAALYALSYTAFHAFLGLTAAWFLHRWWIRRRASWALLLYPILGVGLGLVLHPHFPNNLVVWKVQSIDFFQSKTALNVGPEIGPHNAPNLVWLNLAWIVGLGALWACGKERSAEGAGSRDDTARNDSDQNQRWADLLWIATAVFGLLYFLMLRFSIYFVPFATLAVFFELRRRGRLPGRWMALPGRGRLPVALAVVAALALGVPRAAGLLQGLAGGRGAIPREVEWRAFGESLPAGARVAAEWGSTNLYMFFAPQAAFLNVLDPVFMQVRYPDAYRALRGVFEDREPDVPGTLRAELASDYLALSRFHQPQELFARLSADPRLRLAYQGYTMLYEIVPGTDDGADHGFVLDWRVVPKGSRLPPAEAEIVDLAPWPRAAEDELRAVEGYIDATRFAANPADCVAFVHRRSVAEPSVGVYEIASWGPTRLWVDDDLALSVGGTPRAILGAGVTFPLDLAPGDHRITVLTCPGRDGEERSGFYLLRR